MKMKVNYFYDQEADVFYFSQGKPSASLVSEETGDDVILRRDPKTKQVKGFTILNFSQRMGKSRASVSLPLTMELLSA